MYFIISIPKIEAPFLDVTFIFLFLVNTVCFYQVQDMSNSIPSA